MWRRCEDVETWHSPLQLYYLLLCKVCCHGDFCKHHILISSIVISQLLLLLLFLKSVTCGQCGAGFADSASKSWGGGGGVGCHVDLPSHPPSPQQQQMAPGDMRELMYVSSANPVWPGQSKLRGCVFQLKCQSFLTTSRRHSLSLYLAGNVSLKNSLLFKLPSCSGQCIRPVTGSSAGHTQGGGGDNEDNVSTATAAGGFRGSQLLDMTNVTENTGFSTRA